MPSAIGKGLPATAHSDLPDASRAISANTGLRTRRGSDACVRPSVGAAKHRDGAFAVVVIGLPLRTDEASFRKHFATCGAVSKVIMPTEKNGLLKGDCFLEFVSEQGANTAVELGKTLFAGTSIITVQKVGAKQYKRDRERDPALTVVVRGLSDKVCESEMISSFGACGELRRLTMPTDREGKCKGFAYVQFSDEVSMERALELNRTIFMGNEMTVETEEQEATKIKKLARKRVLPDGPAVFVTSLSWSIEEHSLEEAFSSCGEILGCRILIGHHGRSKGKPTGNGLVVFASEEGQRRAIEEMDGFELAGKVIAVREHTLKPARR